VFSAGHHVDTPRRWSYLARKHRAICQFGHRRVRNPLGVLQTAQTGILNIETVRKHHHRNSPQRCNDPLRRQAFPSAHKTSPVRVVDLVDLKPTPGRPPGCRTCGGNCPGVNRRSRSPQGSQKSPAPMRSAATLRVRRRGRRGRRRWVAVIAGSLDSRQSSLPGWVYSTR